jgi:trk system potassium uptake protein TrkH
MNIQIILYVLGMVLKVEGGLLLLPAFCSCIYQEWHLAGIYVISAAFSFLLGFLLSFKKPERFNLEPKEGMAAVGLAWIVFSLVGAVPFTISGEIPSYIDAIFETVSGVTTTGSSIMTTLDYMSYGNLFWRSFLHWIGGMGVLVFLLAIVPFAGGTFMNLMVAESPGPSISKLVPKLRDTAKTLYQLYLGLSILMLLLLLLAGMPPFDALCIMMGTAGTGGFAIRSSGFADYSWLQCTIVTIFMIAFGINFNVYYLLLRKKWRQALENEEVHWYLGIIFIALVLIVAVVLPMYGDIAYTVHHVLFTIGSIITTTGYSTVDFNLWPSFAKLILVLLMFIGACAGSTGGGIKVSRIIIMVKSVRQEIKNILHPGLVQKVRLYNKPVENKMVRSVLVFLVLYAMIFITSLLLISLDGFDMNTNFTAVAATLNNIGPGLDGVGPTSSFAAYSDLSKIVLSLTMIAGRLELIPLVMLFLPDVWIGMGKRRYQSKAKAQTKSAPKSSAFARIQNACHPQEKSKPAASSFRAQRQANPKAKAYIQAEEAG